MPFAQTCVLLGVCACLLQVGDSYLHTHNSISRRTSALSASQIDEDEEIRRLDNLVEENKEEWDRLVQNKLQAWKAMRKQGLLDKLEDPEDAEIEKLDKISDKITEKLKPRAQRVKRKPKLLSKLILKKQKMVNVEEEEAMSDGDDATANDVHDFDDGAFDLDDSEFDDDDDDTVIDLEFEDDYDDEEFEEDFDNDFSEEDEEEFAQANEESTKILKELDSITNHMTQKLSSLADDAEAMSVLGSILGVDTDEEDKPDYSEYELDELRTKFHSVAGKKGSAIKTFALFNEVKDKEIYDTQLLEDCVMALAKFDSPKIALSALKSLKSMNEEGKLEGTKKFYKRFANACYVNGLIQAGDGIKEILVSEGLASEESFIPALTCVAIYACSAQKNPVISGHMADSKASTTHSTQTKGGSSDKGQKGQLTVDPAVDAERLALADENLALFFKKMHIFDIAEINLVIRALGKRRMLSRVFQVFDAIDAVAEDLPEAGLEPNNESFEFLSNALVGTIEEVWKARAMKDLPKADSSMPEIVFVGRSNVGKSSLVNFLVNRKALASTSATPGHTTQFHFFAVNRGRGDLPNFNLVDVPGLGYAEAQEGTMDSWKSLLERYLSVRDSLGAVVHLVDSRHKLTATDEQMIDLVGRAIDARQAEGRDAFAYSVVLTKTDKASPAALRSTRNDLRMATRSVSRSLSGQSKGAEGVAEGDGGDNNAHGEVPILLTSSFNRAGRVQVWRMILEAIEAARR